MDYRPIIDPARRSSPRDRADPAGWLAAVCRDTEMGVLVRDHDWAATSIGPPDRWPAGLRAAVSMAMASDFPMLVVWGPDLVKIYNDGYRPILGSQKHPAALGAPVATVWPEIWHVIGPLFSSVLATGDATWVEHQSLVVERNGFSEEGFFTYSFSALYDDDGRIGGVLDVVTETTREVVSLARLGAALQLNDALMSARDVTDVCIAAVTSLSASTELRGVDVHLGVAGSPALTASNRRGDVSPVPDEVLRLALADGTARWWASRGAIDGRVDTFVAPFRTRHATDPVAEPSAEPRTDLVADHASDPGGVVVLSVNRHRVVDIDHRGFLQLLVGSIGGAVDNAVRRAIEIGEHRRISETLQAAMLGPATDLPTVAARYLPAVGSLAVGGDWYDVVDLDDHRRAVVVGDCVGLGLEAATVMAQLRSAARAMLLEGRAPSAVLSGLDVFAASVPGAFCTTVMCAVFDRTVGELVYANAGHPPALVVAADGGLTWLGEGAGPPLAADPRVVRADGRHEVRGPREVLALYSDGLIERRGESLDVGLGRLAAAVVELRDAPVNELADALVARLLPEQATDDVVLVVKRLATEGR